MLFRSPLAAPGPVTLSFAASDGVGLSWDADAGIKVSSADNAAALASGSVTGPGNSVSLYGAAEQLNAYLAAGKLRASGNGAIAVSLDGQTTGITAGTVAGSSINVVQASATAVGVALPVLNLPAAYTVSTANGAITLAADALGTSSSNLRTVVLSSTGGTLTAAAEASVGLANSVSANSSQSKIGRAQV